MKLRIFTLPFVGGAVGFDDKPIQEFVADKEVIEVSEHFFVHEKTPWLTVLVSYRLAAPGEGRKGVFRENPRGVLDEPESKAYDALRAWRAARARQEGIPPYLIINNAQLARAVREGAASKADLMRIPGFGEVKAASYGEEMLKILAETRAPGRGAETEGEGV